MDGEVYDAELASTSRESSLLNGLAGATIAVSLVFLMMAISFGDTHSAIMFEGDDDENVRVPVWERGSLNYITDMDNGSVLEFGEYQLMETENEWNSTHIFVVLRASIPARTSSSLIWVRAPSACR